MIGSRVGPIRGGNNFREKAVWTEIGPMGWWWEYIHRRASWCADVGVLFKFLSDTKWSAKGCYKSAQWEGENVS